MCNVSILALHSICASSVQSISTLTQFASFAVRSLRSVRSLCALRSLRTLCTLGVLSTLTACLVLSSCFVLSSCSRHSSPQKQPNLLLITIDTLRADHLGCYGDSQVQTPYIDRLAREGVLFTQAFTPVPITLPSHVSIFTGDYPPSHGVRNNGTFILNPSAITLTEVLKQNGYRTEAVVSSYTLDSCFGLDQGFEFYDDDFSQNQSGPSILHNERIGGETTQRALQWLDQHHQEKFFLWLHYFDPHADYNPPEPFHTRYRKNLYDGEIAYTDQCLGKVLDKLDQLHLLDQTLIVLTADHGEGLGDHKERTHGFFIYDSTLRVPLIFRYPARFHSHRTVKSLVRTIDIMPTILEALSVPMSMPVSMAAEGGAAGNGAAEGAAGNAVAGNGAAGDGAGKNGAADRTAGNGAGVSGAAGKMAGGNRTEMLKMQGVSLFSAANIDQEVLNLDLYCESLYPRLNHNLSPLFGLRTRDWKYVEAPRPELYQLRSDPAEIHNLFADQAGQPGQQQPGQQPDQPGQPQGEDGKLKSRLAEIRKSFADFHAGSATRTQLSAEQRQKLQSLGYVWNSSTGKCSTGNSNTESGAMENGTVGADEGKGKALADPKDYVAVVNQADEGLSYYAKGQFVEAAEIFHNVLKINPADTSTHFMMGLVYEKQQKVDMAIREYQEVVRLDPTYFDARRQLGALYAQGGDLDRGVAELQEAIRLNPNNKEALNLLGGLHIWKQKFKEAETEIQRALTLDPNFADAHFNMGLLYSRSKSLDRALNEFQTALRIKPGYQTIHAELGDLYLMTGKPDQAAGELQKAVQLQPDQAKLRVHLGIAYYSLNKQEQAIMEIQKSLTLDPNNPEAYFHMGVAYGQQGQTDKALDAYQRALKAKPDYPDAYMNIGTIYFGQQAMDQAIAAYRKAVKIAPSYPQAHFNLATAYDTKGMLDQAIEEYQEALRLQPDFTQASLLLERAQQMRMNQPPPAGP
jgi:arylsulfatase A-like enzyme/Tfp pilus assembly protein PilF